MAWTSPATAVAGSVLTAAWLNVYLRDNSNDLDARVQLAIALSLVLSLLCAVVLQDMTYVAFC